MIDNNCKAKTSSGKECSRKAESSGFCKQHEERNKTIIKKQKYDKFVGEILKVCKTKGWSAYLTSSDTEYQFASIGVSQTYNWENVEGVLDVAFTDKSIKYSIQKTSFHNYGLDSLLSAISIKLEGLGWVNNSDIKEKQEPPSPLSVLTTILKNFDKSARQIKRRYNNRTTIEITDEYDVQDLIHSILRGFFDDVRAEEYTPSYAGSSSRVDFLLKKERVVIETKFASKKLKKKEVGDQLIIDIAKYQTHPDCEQLFCLIYDPYGEIHNPTGLEDDLSGKHNKLEVKVFVVPH